MARRRPIFQPRMTEFVKIRSSLFDTRQAFLFLLLPLLLPRPSFPSFLIPPFSFLIIMSPPSHTLSLPITTHTSPSTHFRRGSTTTTVITCPPSPSSTATFTATKTKQRTSTTQRLPLNAYSSTPPSSLPFFSKYDKKWRWWHYLSFVILLVCLLESFALSLGYRFLHEQASPIRIGKFSCYVLFITTWILITHPYYHYHHSCSPISFSTLSTLQHFSLVFNTIDLTKRHDYLSRHQGIWTCIHGRYGLCCDIFGSGTTTIWEY